MKFLSIFILLLYIVKINSEKAYNLRIRNTLLRIYISTDKKKVVNEYSNKIVVKTKKRANNFYNKIISKYNDINLFYNTLSEEEKAIIEAIISLYY
jgi:tRNA(Phe) wybutosine-synthesizing methylase Tyw3